MWIRNVCYTIKKYTISLGLETLRNTLLSTSAAHIFSLDVNFFTKTKSIDLDKSTKIRYYFLFWYFNFREFRTSGVSCLDWGRRRNPETKVNVLDFIERWIKFALPQINVLTVLWFDSKIYIANLSVAGETWEKLPEEDTSFDK